MQPTASIFHHGVQLSHTARPRRFASATDPATPSKLKTGETPFFADMWSTTKLRPALASRPGLVIAGAAELQGVMGVRTAAVELTGAAPG